MPVVQEGLLSIAAGKTVALVGLNRKFSLPADVRKMRGDGADSRSAAGDFSITSGVLVIVRLICSI